MPTAGKTIRKLCPILIHSHFTDIHPRTGAANNDSMLPEPAAYTPITIDNIEDQIGLVQEFFKKKLRDNGDKPLIEDDDLPVKQRMPKPRLPPTGKITSPRKRPFKEPGPGKGHPRKKMKLNEGGEATKIGEGEVAGSGTGQDQSGDPVKKAGTAMGKPTNGETMSRETSQRGGGESDTSTAEKPLTNGVVPHSYDDTDGDKMDVDVPVGGKGKVKELNGHSLPSPESVAAS